MTSSNLFSIFEELENYLMTGIEKQIEELERLTKWKSNVQSVIFLLED